MAVACDKQTRPAGIKHFGESGRIAPGIACNVCEQHIDVLHAESLHFRKPPRHISVVDVAAYATEHRSDAFKMPQQGRVAHIACMPHFVATGEVERVAVVMA